VTLDGGMGVQAEPEEGRAGTLGSQDQRFHSNRLIMSCQTGGRGSYRKKVYQRRIAYRIIRQRLPAGSGFACN
jgi:hypothetical protein